MKARQTAAFERRPRERVPSVKTLRLARFLGQLLRVISLRRRDVSRRRRTAPLISLLSLPSFNTRRWEYYREISAAALLSFDNRGAIRIDFHLGTEDPRDAIWRG